MTVSGIVKWIRSLFHVRDADRIPARPRPSWAEIVEIMQDQSPSCFPDAEIVKVIYSDDREKRFVLDKSKDGVFQYRMEQIEAFDDEEWGYISRDPNALPGMWAAFGYSGESFFGTEQEAWNEFVYSPEYKLYFE